MVSSEPPLAQSGNSTHLLDVGIPAPQVPAPSLVVGTASGPPVADRRTIDLSVVRERALDDINNMRTMRNERRAEKREYDENVSGDKSIMGMDDYLAMTTVPGMTASPGQGLPLRAVMPPHPSPTINTTMPVPSNPKKIAFTDEDTCKNVQAPMQNTIPNALLEMFRVGAYIPMSMFLVENMELIWLDQGVNTHKGLGVRVIEVANF